MSATVKARSFLNRWGEPITAILSDEVSRPVIAVVHRDVSQAVANTPGAVRPMTQVFLANDSTDGISSAELDTATLKLSFAKRIGGTAETFRVHQLVSHDSDMIGLEVR